MGFLILLLMFAVVLVVCIRALGELEPCKYLLAVCVALVCIISVAREPRIIRSLEVPYQALALTVLLLAVLWTGIQISKSVRR